MKYVDEFRDFKISQDIIRKINDTAHHAWTIMDICGGQTHSFMRFGIPDLLSKNIHLSHGPGCPVCVTPTGVIDQALKIAQIPNVILCSFGDMLRVPGSTTDLMQLQTQGFDVRVVYSTLDAVTIAKDNPKSEVVFLGVGFETTAPVHALAVKTAHTLGIKNFSVLLSIVLVPPAIEAILSSPDNTVQGFLAAGHVSTVMGYWQYDVLSEKYHVPIVVTGFEPVDLLRGLYQCVQALEEKNYTVINAYERLVTKDGNQAAQELLQDIYTVQDQEWRGLGIIPNSGLTLREPYHAYDAEKKFALSAMTSKDEKQCHAGDVLRGVIEPHQCPAFQTICTPENPLGALMVSDEGTCSAYYRYQRRKVL